MGSTDDMKQAVDRVVNGYTWPPAVRVGDRYRTPAGEYRIDGIELVRITTGGPHADRIAREGALPLPYDDLEADKLTRLPAEVDATRYRVSDALAESFDRLLLALGGPAIVGLFEVADRLGFRVYLVGGAVRDTLLGRPVKDLDLAGTLPVVLCQQALIGLTVEFRSPRRQDLLGYTVPLASLSAQAVLHIERPYKHRRQVRTDKLLEYAPLRLAWVTDGNQGWWRFGSRLTDDVTWRDLGCNTLFYDPLDQVVLDPADALADLGLTAQGVTKWQAPAGPLVPAALVPLDIPAPCPPHWAPKALARVMKALVKFPIDDLEPVRAWVERNHGALRSSLEADAERFDRAATRAQAEARPGGRAANPASGCELFKQVYQAFDRLWFDPFRWPRRDLEPAQREAVDRVIDLLPDDLQVLATRIIDPDPLRQVRVRGAEAEPLHLRGTGLREATLLPDGRYRLGGDLPGPDNPSDVDAWFVDELDGARPTWVRVEGVDGEVAAIAGPGGVFVETGLLGELITRDDTEAD